MIEGRGARAPLPGSEGPTTLVTWVPQNRQGRLLTNFLRLPDRLICLSRIDQAVMAA